MAIGGTMPSFYCNDHQGKAKAYVDALMDAGYLRNLVRDGTADFCLLDLDWGSRVSIISDFAVRGKPTFLYPHTARPVLQWDGMYPSSPHTTAVFTIAQGGVDIPRMYGLVDKPIHAVGWTYCDIVPFEKKSGSPQKVLFAPIHVNGNGYMTNRERNLNSKVFHKLLSTDVELTVRFLYNLEWNGLWEEEGVTYVQGKPDQSTKEIDEADVVVSHQNMGYLAVARGKPTLFMAEYLPPISGNTDAAIKVVASWDKYKDELMFPLDILAGDTKEMLQIAWQHDLARDWKHKYIGSPFNAEQFVEILEGYL